ncbi:MAG: response regulator [Patescibacteria group bacterium]
MAETRSLLVVEDDPILKNLLGHTLAGKYQTLYASDGNEALALLESSRPVLVLLDLMLPTVDGYAVLAAIRARTDELKDVPVIVVSNLGSANDSEKAIKLGANDYLIKAEVAVEEIVAKIESFLATNAPAPVSAAPAAPEAPAQPAAPAPVPPLA